MQPLAIAALAVSFASAAANSVRRPESQSHSITFEYDEVIGLPSSAACDFDAGFLVTDEYQASRRVRFSGPGFGAFNGGVLIDGCTFDADDYPPLANASLIGSRTLGFSTLHLLDGTNGKPVAPESLRFDTAVTNLRLGLAGIDDKPVTVELYDGVFDSFEDQGTLLRRLVFPLTPEMRIYELVNDNQIFVDCVRRVVISSPAKLFLLDEISYGESTATDATCQVDTTDDDYDIVDSAAAPRRAGAPAVPTLVAAALVASRAASALWRHGHAPMARAGGPSRRSASP